MITVPTHTIDVNLDSNWHQYASQLVTLSNGNILVSWADSDPYDDSGAPFDDTSGWRRKAAIFSNTGERISEEFYLHDPKSPSSPLGGFPVFAGDDGGFFTIYDDGNGTRITRYDSAGNTIGTPNAVDTPEEFTSSSAAVDEYGRDIWREFFVDSVSFHVDPQTGQILVSFDVRQLDTFTSEQGWQTYNGVYREYLVAYDLLGNAVGDPRLISEDNGQFLDQIHAIISHSNGETVFLSSGFEVLETTELGLPRLVRDVDPSNLLPPDREDPFEAPTVHDFAAFSTSGQLIYLTVDAIVEEWTPSSVNVSYEGVSLFGMDQNSFEFTNRVVAIESPNPGGYTGTPDVVSLPFGQFLVVYDDYGQRWGQLINADFTQNGAIIDLSIDNAGMTSVLFSMVSAGVDANGDVVIAATYSTHDGSQYGEPQLAFYGYDFAGNDVLVMSDMDNRLDAGAGDDDVRGSNSGDVVVGGSGNDKIDAGGGDDFVYGGNGSDRIWGGAWSDKIWGGEGHDILNGGDGADTINGDSGNDVIVGGAGKDLIYGGIWNDRIWGGEDRDILNGGTGADTIYGGGGDDAIIGGAGKDRISGGDWSDKIWGGDDADVLNGDNGDDVIYGAHGDDILVGGAGKDKLFGGIWSDKLWGGADQDQLDGGAGNDRLAGGAGNDVHTGGAGADVFIFASGGGVDRVTDFTDGVDRIQIEGHNGGFSNLNIIDYNGNRVIFYDGGRIILENDAGLALTSDDFVFV
ncbi:calcium-binding protein [Aliiroseovarius crassostreae]|uniref:calcium-binding protein n=1 Tax=Aliiroseovarius crassostreae TaxID=154981 RepID=UPI002208A69D|nr:calcium-binding protein [Aliiroseovarius crassostreae]UWQ08934.1 hypothetical protein K3X25_04990 [Aliiroseovarius crassostreae]